VAVGRAVRAVPCTAQATVRIAHFPGTACAGEKKPLPKHDGTHRIDVIRRIRTIHHRSEREASC